MARKTRGDDPQINQIIATIVLLSREQETYLLREPIKRVPSIGEVTARLKKGGWIISSEMMGNIHGAVIRVLMDARAIAHMPYSDAIKVRIDKVAGSLRRKKAPFAPPGTAKEKPSSKKENAPTEEEYHEKIRRKLMDWLKSTNFDPRRESPFLANLRHILDKMRTQRHARDLREWNAIQGILSEDPELMRRAQRRMREQTELGAIRSREGVERTTPNSGEFTTKNPAIQRGGVHPRRRQRRPPR